MEETPIPEAIGRCVDSCQLCHRVCVEQATRLLETIPRASKSNIMEALVRCIGVARVAAEMLLVDAGVHHDACDMCATACRSCADLCKSMPGMEDCVAACTECASCCESISKLKVA